MVEWVALELEDLEWGLDLARDLALDLAEDLVEDHRLEEQRR